MPSTPFYLIAVGGGAGAVARAALQAAVQARWPHPWPVGTLAVNLLGCLAAGLVLGLLERHALAASWRGLLLTGVCGGFTTFSAFALDGVALLRGGQVWAAALYAGGSVAGGLLLAAVGYAVVMNYEL